MWRSSRGNTYYSSSEAILKGLASDGGLFLLDNLSKIEFDSSWLQLDYKEISKKILSHFFVDFCGSYYFYGWNDPAIKTA